MATGTTYVITGTLESVSRPSTDTMIVLAKRPDGFGYQSQTWSVVSIGCQKLNAAPVSGFVVGQPNCASAGMNVPSL